METYKHGYIHLKTPKHVATGARILRYSYSYGVHTGSLRFFTASGKEVADNSVLYDKHLKPTWEKRFTRLSKYK